MLDASLIAARGLSYAAMLLAAGLPLYALTTRRDQHLRHGALALLAATAAVASIWWALASVAAMMAQPIALLDQATVTAVLAATPLGTVLAVRLAALATLMLAAALRLPVILLVLPAAIALASAAWTGHAGATEGIAGSIHRLADVLHLLAAATWIGALATLLAGIVGKRSAGAVTRNLAGFATTGTAIVAILLATGIANTLFIAGWPLPLRSTWALLLGLKIALFALMLGFAALNRWRLTPALADDRPGARRNLRRSLAGETLLGFAVVALVAALGTLDPAG